MWPAGGMCTCTQGRPRPGSPSRVSEFLRAHWQATREARARCLRMHAAHEHQGTGIRISGSESSVTWYCNRAAGKRRRPRRTQLAHDHRTYTGCILHVLGKSGTQAPAHQLDLELRRVVVSGALFGFSSTVSDFLLCPCRLLVRRTSFLVRWTHDEAVQIK